VLRAVRRAAELEIQSMYGHPTRLLLAVKVEKNWRKNFWFLQQLGYTE
jgi:GTPase Era involved in 16S rRNA processing